MFCVYELENGRRAPRGDTWVFDPVNIEWTNLSRVAAALGSTPPPRRNFGMASADGIIFLFGGYSLYEGTNP
jgi:hypothetical protein